MEHFTQAADIIIGCLLPAAHLALAVELYLAMFWLSRAAAAVVVELAAAAVRVVLGLLHLFQFHQIQQSLLVAVEQVVLEIIQ